MIVKNLLGERLKELRGTASQMAFASQIGVKQTTYSSWERGRQEPPLDMLLTMSASFGVTTDWLLGATPIKGAGPQIVAHDSAIAIGSGNTATTGKPAVNCLECPLMQAHLAKFSPGVNTP